MKKDRDCNHFDIKKSGGIYIARLNSCIDAEIISQLSEEISLITNYQKNREKILFDLSAISDWTTYGLVQLVACGQLVTNGRGRPKIKARGRLREVLFSLRLNRIFEFEGRYKAKLNRED